MQEEYEKIVLENGLRVILAPRRYFSGVCVVAFVQCGANYESREVSGINHFVEHVLFKGTRRLNTLEKLTGAVEGRGGKIHAETGEEVMNFSVETLSDHLETALDVLSDMITDPLLDPNEIDKEAGVIMAEIDQEEDNPQEFIRYVLWNKILYGDNQPAGWTILGSRQNIRKIRRDPQKIRDHFEKCFRAGGIVLCIAGNFEKDTALDLAVKYFSKVRPGCPPKKQNVSEFQYKPRIMIRRRDMKQALIGVGVRAPKINFYTQRKGDALILISKILGRGMASRICLALTEKMGVAYEVSTEPYLYTDRAQLLTLAGVDFTKMVAVTNVILKEYRRIATEIVPEKELVAAKEYIRGITLMGLDSLYSKAEFFGHQEFLYGKIKLPEEDIQGCMEITAEEILNVAKSIFLPENLNIVILAPNAPFLGKKIRKAANEWWD